MRKLTVIKYVLIALFLIPLHVYAELQTLKVPNKEGNCMLTLLTTLKASETITWSSNSCKNGLAEGEGEVHWSDGRMYKGTFSKGLRQKGRFTYSEGYCEGEFKEALQGKAKCTNNTEGSVHEGQYDKGDRSGYGVMTKGGTRYEGDWAQDQKNGKGVMLWANGDRYEGEYKDGVYHGQGTYYNVRCKCTYVGEFKNDDKNGFGKTTWADGDWYEGEYRNDKRNGKGTYYWAKTGRKFVGLFKDGVEVSDQAILST